MTLNDLKQQPIPERFQTANKQSNKLVGQRNSKNCKSQRINGGSSSQRSQQQISEQPNNANADQASYLSQDFNAQNMIVVDDLTSQSSIANSAYSMSLYQPVSMSSMKEQIFDFQTDYRSPRNTSERPTKIFIEKKRESSDNQSMDS